MSFDRLAPHYRWMELILAGRTLQRCRTAFLYQVLHCRNVLILGEGNGRFLLDCRRLIPEARVTVVDSSGVMLERAVQRLRRNSVSLDGVELVLADAQNWCLGFRRFDLIVTHFFLDCFDAPQLAAVIQKTAAAARPDSSWLLADFRVPAKGVVRVRAAIIHKMMYLFFRCTTGIGARSVVLPDDSLCACGFMRRYQALSEWGLLTSELWIRGPERHVPQLTDSSPEAPHEKKLR